MLSPAIARELRERGYDVLAVAEHPGWAALSDPEVLAVARTERRAVVTNNLRDYRPLHSDAITPGGPGHFGMAFMPGSYRRTKADTGRIISCYGPGLDGRRRRGSRARTRAPGCAGRAGLLTSGRLWMITARAWFALSCPRLRELRGPGCGDHGTAGPDDGTAGAGGPAGACAVPRQRQFVDAAVR